MGVEFSSKLSHNHLRPISRDRSRFAFCRFLWFLALFKDSIFLVRRDKNDATFFETQFHVQMGLVKMGQSKCNGPNMASAENACSTTPFLEVSRIIGIVPYVWLSAGSVNGIRG